VSAKTHKFVNVGRISGLFGVKGWVKIHSYTEPRANIVGYGVWRLRQHGVESRLEVEDGRGQGGSVVAKLRGIDDREQARAWIGADIAIERGQLPACAPDEYYWTDLEGLEVRTVEGDVLGKVEYLVATGSNDVLVLGGAPERLIPFVLGSVIRSVDLDAGVIIADWSPEY
jgi:16S rRNA processing protein RimM